MSDNHSTKGEKIMTATINLSAIFNGTYTITNVATGVYRTLQVKTQKPDAKFAAGNRIAALLTGSDNETSYTGFGFVGENSVSIWRKRQTPAYKYFAHILPKAAQSLVGTEGIEVEGTFTAAGRDYRVQLSKRCLMCNRKLTTPESIERGIGPDCAKRVGIV